MIKMEMRLNGPKITSGSQFTRELTRAAEQHVEAELRRSKAPGIRLRKVADGFAAEGDAAATEQLRHRLK